jgi:Flp pilus assembly pilin Flp
MLGERKTNAHRTAWFHGARLRCKNLLAGLLGDTRGQEMVEYAVFVALVALVAALALPPLVDRVTTVLNDVNKTLPVGNPTNCGNLNPGAHGGRSPCAPH